MQRGGMYMKGGRHMKSMVEILHIRQIKRRAAVYLVNHVFVGTRTCFFEIKRKLLNAAGFRIGEGTKVVGPVECTGQLTVGRNCWIGKNLKVNGNGSVVIGDNCDLAPEITFQTGGHFIGGRNRRAGEGHIFHQRVGNGVWIGGRTTVLNNAVIGDGCVIAGCTCVDRDVPDDVLAGGVPWKIIRQLKEQ